MPKDMSKSIVKESNSPVAKPKAGPSGAPRKYEVGSPSRPHRPYHADDRRKKNTADSRGSRVAVTKEEKKQKQPAAQKTSQPLVVAEEKALVRPTNRRHEEVADDDDDPEDLKEFKKIKKIGQGSYGVVYRARRRTTNKRVALKQVGICPKNGLHYTSLRELFALKALKHDNIIGLKDTIIKDKHLYMVLDYADTDLRKYMNKFGRPGLPKELVKSFMYQLLSRLHYCHSKKVMHRDLKPGNLLIDRTGQLKIADFGLSRTFGRNKATYTNRVGTGWYRAPELLLGSVDYSTEVDMWSCGCILAEMMCLTPLFQGRAEIDQLFKIFGQLGTPDETTWPGFMDLPHAVEKFPNYQSQDLRETLEGYQEYLKFPDSAYDLLKSLLKYDPSSRLTAKKAMGHPYFSEDEDVEKK
ncbi:MAG: kinase-like domain-containing protein [Benjaminiella poitrasii]|nr:MAG: kinase-like domain-containing protein [Benjaminiella poitrasii]